MISAKQDLQDIPGSSVMFGFGMIEVTYQTEADCASPFWEAADVVEPPNTSPAYRVAVTAAIRAFRIDIDEIPAPVPVVDTIKAHHEWGDYLHLILHNFSSTILSLSRIIRVLHYNCA